MKNLIINRPAAGYHDERRFRVFIDGKEVAALRQKSSVSVEIPDKPFELQVKSRLGRSPIVTIDPSETTAINLLVNNKYHRYNPALLGQPPLLLAVLLFFKTENPLLRIAAVVIAVLVAIWFIVMLVVKREEWIEIERAKK